MAVVTLAGQVVAVATLAGQVVAVVTLAGQVVAVVTLAARARGGEGQRWYLVGVGCEKVN